MQQSAREMRINKKHLKSRVCGFIVYSCLFGIETTNQMLRTMYPRIGWRENSHRIPPPRICKYIYIYIYIYIYTYSYIHVFMNLTAGTNPSVSYQKKKQQQ